MAARRNSVRNLTLARLAKNRSVTSPVTTHNPRKKPAPGSDRDSLPTNEAIKETKAITIQGRIRMRARLTLA